MQRRQVHSTPRHGSVSRPVPCLKPPRRTGRTAGSGTDAGGFDALVRMLPETVYLYFPFR